MENELLEDLSQEEPTEFQKALLTKAKQLIELSSGKMSKYYERWDNSDKVFRGKRTKDDEDKRAEERGEPVKMQVPMTYSQVMTFVSYIIGLYNQKRTMFELRGNTMEGHSAARIAEQLLERDWKHNNGEHILFQFLLDIAKFSLGVIKHSWVEESEFQWQKKVTPEQKIMGITVRQEKEDVVKEEVVTYQGNKIINVSPYRFFPDPRLPLHRFQEGEFCGSEDEYSRSQLLRMEQSGMVAGIEHIKPFSTEAYTRRNSQRFSFVSTGHTVSGLTGQSTGSILVTEVQLDIVPSEFKVDGKALGTETYPVKYLVWYANDNRLIRVEPLDYAHNKFTYDVAQFTPDQHNLVTESLTDITHYLQDVVTWFINSHISSVRKNISNKFLVDPSSVEMKDFANRKSVIRTKQGASGRPLNTLVQQLGMSDVTQNHIRDSEYIFKLIQITTGISENALGQFSGGRRSAREAAQVSQGSSARLLTHARLIYKTALEPLAKKLVSNLRDGLTGKTYLNITGVTGDAVEGAKSFLTVDRTDLIGSFDFEIFDGTLPSEKLQRADVLKELVLGFLQNPETVQLTGYDIDKIITEILILQGIKNPERFKQQMMQDGQIQQALNGGGQIPEAVQGPAAGAAQQVQGEPSMVSDTNQP